MNNQHKHIISATDSIKLGLEKLNTLAVSLTLFVINEQEQLVGTLTDGDIRRALLKDVSLAEPISKIMHTNFVCLVNNKFTIDDLEGVRQRKILLLPVVDADYKIKRIINLEEKKSILPIDAVIMAGGEGRRLRPLTNTVPKPLLNVGNRPIIDYNVSRLSDYGVEHVNITVKYLGQQIIDFFNQRTNKLDIAIDYIIEDEPLGTIGALSLVPSYSNDVILLMNSDLLTNIDFEDFYVSFINSNADMAVATIAYPVVIPYAVVETSDGFITQLKEKPTYTYYSNAGIYLLKRELLNFIPKGGFYNATDLMDKVLEIDKKIYAYPIVSYWLDIGRHEDFEKANEDIKHIKF